MRKIKRSFVERGISQEVKDSRTKKPESKPIEGGMYSEKSSLVTSELSPEKLSLIYNAAANGDIGKIINLYKKIESDAQIRGLVNKRRKAPARYKWGIKIKKDSPKAKEAAQILTEMFEIWSMKKFRRDAMYGIFHGIRLYANFLYKENGYILFAQPSVINPTRYFEKSSQEIMYFEDDKNSFGDIAIYTTETEKVYLTEFEDYEISCFKLELENGFTDKAGVMFPMLRWYVIKYYAVKFWIEYAEFNGFPTSVIKTTEAMYRLYKDELDEFARTIGRSKFGILIEGMDAEISNTANSASNEIFKSLADYADKQIAIAVYGQAESSGGSGGATYASGSVYKLDEMDTVIDDAEWIDEQINDNYVKIFLRINFPELAPTDLEFYTMTPVSKEWKMVKEKWELAGRLGLKGLSKKQFEDETGISFAKEGDDKLDLSLSKTNNHNEEDDKANKDQRKDQRKDGGSVEDK